MGDFIFKFGNTSYLCTNQQNKGMYNKLKRILKERKISHKDLAAQLGIKPNTLSVYFNGDPDFPKTTLERVADILGLSLSEIIDDESQIEDELPSNCAIVESPHCHKTHVVRITTKP